MELFLLMEDSDGAYGAQDVRFWSDDRAALEALALRMEWENYRKQKDSIDRHNASKPVEQRMTIYSPDECSYRRFTVEPVQKAPQA